MPEGSPTLLPLPFQALIVAMATDERAGCWTGRQRAPQTHPNTGGRRRGRRSPPSLGWMAEAAPPTNTEIYRVGEGQRHKEASLLLGVQLGSGGGGKERGHRGRGLNLSHNPEEGAESAGPDWKQMGPPCQARDTRSRAGVGGGEKGRPHPGSQSWPALLPGAGLKTPRERPGTPSPSGSWELGGKRQGGVGTLTETQGQPPGRGGRRSPN